MLLNFKDDKSECPCPEEIRDQLLDFHEDLMEHCGKVSLLLLLFFVVGRGSTTPSTRGLLLAQHVGITPGCAQETLCVDGNQP